jgi:adenylate cyclase
MSRGLSSADILALLNDYFEVMNTVVTEHRGLLNKYMGDGLLVLYGVPLREQPQVSAYRAVSSALDMLRHVAERQADGRWPFSIGIGIHSGIVSAGNIGASNRMEYSVIGDAVNLASRLESLNKEYRTQLIISEDTHALVCEAFVTRALGSAEVKGIDEPVPVYEVLSAREPHA